MKICFYTGDISRSGGTERVLANLLNPLSKIPEHEICILSVIQKNDTLFYNYSKDIRLYTLFKKNESISKKIIKAIIRLRKFIKKHQIDILINVEVMLHLSSLPATLLTKTKLVDWDHFSFYENLGVKYRDWARKSASYFSNAIITITKEDKEQYIKELKPRCPVYQIYNPIEFTDEILQYSTESKLIISAGRLTRIKGFDLLIEVARIVFERYPNWRWIILGDGEEKETLQSKINFYKLNENIILKGRVTDISNYFSQSSIFVLTSRSESFGLVLAEAKLFNLPCVSFACKSGPSEIILNDVNGYLVDCFNIELMAEKICKLICDPELRKEFSKHAKDDTLKFSNNIITKKWITLFEYLQTN